MSRASAHVDKPNQKWKRTNWKERLKKKTATRHDENREDERKKEF